MAGSFGLAMGILPTLHLANIRTISDQTGLRRPRLSVRFGMLQILIMDTSIKVKVHHTSIYTHHFHVSCFLVEYKLMPTNNLTEYYLYF